MTTRLPALICVKADAPKLSRDPLLLEGELVRRGARDAHLTADGRIAVSVVAHTQGEACALVDALLQKATGPL